MRGQITSWLRLGLIATAVLAVSACSKPEPPQLTYTLVGQVMAVDVPQKMVTVKHDEIKGFMGAMTMPYGVRDPKLLDGLAPGDLINGTLVVESNGAYLSTIKKTGQAPMPKPPDGTPPASASAAPPGQELLKPGDTVPDAPFIDQDGKTRRFASFKGSPLVLTFMYTRCPMTAFCPLMDKNFAEIQRSLEVPGTREASGTGIHLVSVTFDPETDTPAVLKRHADGLHVNAARWTFLTSLPVDQGEVERFASRFGVFVTRSASDPSDITHNLRTAIIDANGKLVKVFTGNDWKPQEILSEIRETGMLSPAAQ